MCLGTFSRRGAVALATIYPCAECASSRSIFIVWKRSFLYDKIESCNAGFYACGDRVCDIFPLRRSAILVERFLSYGNKVSYTIKNARRNSLPPDAHILPGFSRKTVLFFKDRAARFEPKPISVTFTVNSARHPCGTREFLFSAALFPT